jgi:hypothetical protein
MVSLLELLEDAHRTFNSGRRDLFFYGIIHGTKRKSSDDVRAFSPSSVAIVMNYGFLAIAKFILFFDHSFALGFAFFDNGGAIPIAVTIFVRLANCYAGANRANPNAHIVC